MRKIERYVKCTFDKVEQKMKVKSATAEGAEAFNNFLLRMKDGEVFRETCERVGNIEQWRDNSRSQYRKMLRMFIRHCHEDFSKNIVGASEHEKEEALHFTLKDQYCKLHPECLSKKINAVTGEERIYVFSTSRDTCTLDDAQLESYYGWVPGFLNSLHKDKYGYEIPLTDY